MKILRVAAVIRRGRAIAHTTSTIPGIAALPDERGLRRVQKLKGRRGPFLLLAASTSVAARLVCHYPPTLRQQMASSWPGSTTLVLSARPGLPQALYLKGRIAVRVDGDAGVRLLAKLCGGLLLSSSLNRRGKSWRMPDRGLRMRWYHYLDAIETGGKCSGTPSRVIEICRSGERVLRG